MPDVRMPDGTIIRNVPEGTTKEQVLAKYQASKAAPEDDIGVLESAGRGALETLTFGGVDELYGGARALFGDKTYEEYRDEFRESQQEAREANPFAFGVGEYGSMLIPGLGAARVAGTATKLLPKAARAAGIGGGYGALAGAGYSEGETGSEVVGDIVRGGVTGATLGAAVPVVGRGLQRAMHRYSPEQRGVRAVREMVDPESAKKALDENPGLLLGDLTEGTRLRLAQFAAADDELAKKLMVRQRGVAKEVLDAIPQPQKPSGAGIDATYDATRSPRATLDALQAKYANTKKGQRLWKDAEEAAERWVGYGYTPGSSGRNRRYAGAVLHQVQSKMRKKAKKDGSWNRTRDQFLEDTRQFNPRLADSVRQYGREFADFKELDQAYKKLRTGTEAKEIGNFLRDIDRHGATRDRLVQLFGSEDAVDQFSRGLQAQRAAVQANKMAERLGQPDVVRQTKTALNEIKKGVDDLWKSAAADRLLGVQQKLGTAAAMRRLIFTLGEHLPFISGMMRRQGRAGPSTQQTIQRLLTSRELPQYQAAQAQALTGAGAGIAGGLGILGGQ